jgi:NAD(P)-dependent dehydrogenase (short-subunit alcohol dehydrogenase family)
MTFSGQNCVITGANSGLGFAVSRDLARRGANTIMVCRHRARGESAVREIKKETPNASVHLMVCDLASVNSICRFIEDFKAGHSTLDLLLNNAAVMKRKRTMTKDGFEMMFQVNYLAPFMLMNGFVELLKRSPSHKIINIARPSDDLRLDFDDLQFSQNYQMYNSFFKTKLCLLLSSLELSRRHERDGLTVIMADPGPFKSNLVRDVPWFGWVKNLFSPSVETAAGNILFVASLDEATRKDAKVFEGRQATPLTSYWNDTNVSQRLWSITESLLENRQSIEESARAIEKQKEMETGLAFH